MWYLEAQNPSTGMWTRGEAILEGGGTGLYLEAALTQYPAGWKLKIVDESGAMIDWHPGKPVDTSLIGWQNRGGLFGNIAAWWKLNK